MSVSGGTLAREQITKDGYFETDGYEVRGIRFYITPLTNDGIPESLASAAVVGLHVWKRNTLLSIAVGTVFYMFLVQVVF